MSWHRVMAPVLASLAVACSSQANFPLPSIKPGSPNIDYQLLRAAKYRGERMVEFGKKISLQGQCSYQPDLKRCFLPQAGVEYLVNVTYRDLNQDGRYDRLEVNFSIPPQMAPKQIPLIKDGRKMFVTSPGELTDAVDLNSLLYLYRRFLGEISLYTQNSDGTLRHEETRRSYPCFDALGRQLPFDDHDCVPPEH